jgi:hypothetical protein
MAQCYWGYRTDAIALARVASPPAIHQQKTARRR